MHDHKIASKNRCLWTELAFAPMNAASVVQKYETIYKGKPEKTGVWVQNLKPWRLQGRSCMLQHDNATASITQQYGFVVEESKC